MFAVAGRASAEKLSATGAAVLLKILSYDQELASRADSTVVIGVAVPAGAGGDSASLQSVSQLKSVKVLGRAIRAVPVQLRSSGELRKALIAESVDALIVPDGLSATQLTAVIDACRNTKIPSMGLSRAAAEGGIAVGVEIRDQVTIYVNAAEAFAQGARFRSELLRLAIRVDR